MVISEYWQWKKTITGLIIKCYVYILIWHALRWFCHHQITLPKSPNHSAMRSIPTDKENAAVQLSPHGLSVCKVAAQVGISVATDSCIAQKNLPGWVGKTPGQPCLLSDMGKYKISCDITSGTYNIAVQVTASLACGYQH